MNGTLTSNISEAKGITYKWCCQNCGTGSARFDFVLFATSAVRFSISENPANKILAFVNICSVNIGILAILDKIIIIEIYLF